MERKYRNASRYIESARFYIKKKGFQMAWLYAVKLHTLFPSTESKRELKYLFINLSKEEEYSSINF